MSIVKNNLQFYLTAGTSNSLQGNPFQSTGGYPSKTRFVLLSSLTAPVNTDSDTLTISNGNNLEGSNFVLIGREVISISSSTNTSAVVTQRGDTETFIGSYQSGNNVFALSVNDLFDNRFNDFHKQYRCLAIKNNSTINTAYDVSVYVKDHGLNVNSKIRIMVEAPKSDYYSGIVSSGNKLTFVDSSLTYSDNTMRGAVLTFTAGSSNSGQIRKIVSNDATTKSIVMDSSLPLSVVAGDPYFVLPAPSQRVVSGTIAPASNSAYASSLSAAYGVDDAIGININGNRHSGSDLRPHDVIYIWIERSFIENSASYENNRIILTLRYRTS